MVNSNNTRRLIQTTEQALEISRRFEDEIRLLSMRLHELEPQITTADNLHLIRILSTWLQPFLIQLFDTTETLSDALDYLQSLDYTGSSGPSNRVEQYSTEE